MARPASGAYQRHLPHYQRDDKTNVVTFVTRHRTPLPPAARDLVLGHVVYDHERRYALHAAVVMPDHVHLMLTPLRDADDAVFGLAEILQALKGASAHSVNKLLGRSGSLWQSESWDTMLRRDEKVREKAEYICANPTRAGLAATEDEYPWVWREWVEGDGRDSA